ncbi:PTS mannose/fructose/sorbose/N-acetylgalactosamine transporter subunit IIC [Enterocloster lavalensis]|uniref:PTS mannose/fructose/sorbose/N-acetylgalactosamine transporter subunit IIC n=1 Tax=Enterocloster lavalensis TaxID=460384 RepID=UPI002666A930|nr:PTS sugar transporter subunit IIC [Enterocloster lavalensis]
MIVKALLVALVMFIAKFSDHGWGQPLIERPIVCGAMVGLVLGNLHEGVMIGASLELVFLGTITIGGSLPADLAVGSVLATAFSLLLGQEQEVAIALAVPISLLATYVYQVFKLFCTTMVQRYDRLLNEGNDKAALKQNIVLTLMYPAIFTVIAFFAVMLGTNAIESLVNAIPEWVMTGLKTAGNVLPALGFAILLKTLWKADIAPFFFIGFVCAAYLGLGAIPVAIIGAGIAVYVCLTDYNHIKEMNVLKASGVAEVSDKEDFFND